MVKLDFQSLMRRLAAGDYQSVYKQAIAALRQNEKDPLAFLALGLIASDNGHKDKALEFFTKAADLKPLEARYQAYHARALLASGQIEQAIATAERASSLSTQDALVSDMIGTVLSRAGRHGLAIDLFKAAVKRRPNFARFHFNLAASAQFNGDLDLAKSAYEKTLALDPRFYHAWYALTGLETQDSDMHLPKLKSLFEAAGADAEARLLLGHAIAKTLEDLGEYEQSLEWLNRAKALKSKQVRFDPQKMKAQFAQAKTLSESLPSASGPAEASDGAPIFIIGLPRTGTTLLDRIISSHKDVTSLGELGNFTAWLGRSSTPAQAGQAYVKDTQALSETQRTTDKTPHNFLHAGLIHQALPNARIIALRRGAMDSCLSNYRQLFAIHNPTFDYSYDLMNTAAYFAEFDALMQYWEATLPPERFTQVSYEDIVHDQENQTRRLLEFCNLGWDEACLNFYDSDAPVDSASSVQVRQPLYTQSIGRWTRYGDKLDELKAALGPLAGI